MQKIQYFIWKVNCFSRINNCNWWRYLHIHTHTHARARAHTR